MWNLFGSFTEPFNSYRIWHIATDTGTGNLVGILLLLGTVPYSPAAIYVLSAKLLVGRLMAGNCKINNDAHC